MINITRITQNYIIFIMNPIDQENEDGAKF